MQKKLNEIKEYSEEELFQTLINYATNSEQIIKFNRIGTNMLSKEKYSDDIRAWLLEICPGNVELVDRVFERFNRFMWGYHILEPLIADPDITDIRVLDYDNIWYTKKGKSYPSDISFSSGHNYERFVEKILLKNKVNFSDKNAMPTFSDNTSEQWNLRFNLSSKLVIASDNTVMHIRKAPKNKKGFDTLINEGMLSAEMAELIISKINSGESFLISGETGSGKTTLMNAMLEEIPASWCVCCIEDAEELFSEKKRQLVHYRTVDNKGDGKIKYDLKSIATNALLINTDVFILSEIKGDEALPFAKAANSGSICWASNHSGSIEDSYSALVYNAKHGEASFSTEELLYLFKSLKNGIHLDRYKVDDMAEVYWDNKTHTLGFVHIPMPGHAEASEGSTVGKRELLAVPGEKGGGNTYASG